MSGNNKQTVAQYLVEFLKNEGVRYIYGIPGGQPLAILDAIYETDGIDFINTRHENAAAHAADATGRLTGIPGVCLSTTGPGATNLITGVGGAFRDSSPMIVITANNNRKDILRDDAQDADHVALFSSLTKWSVQISEPGHVHEILSEAFQRATTGTPGPVLLDFTRDVLSKEMPEEKKVFRKAMKTRILGDESQLAEAMNAISQAQKPVMWVGNGVKISKASHEVLQLAEQFCIPVVTTFNGIGSVPTTHPYVFGAKSRMGGILGEEILAEADLLIAVGNSLNGPSTSRWTAKLPQKKVQIDIEPANIGKHYPDTLGVWGDAKVCLSYIGQRMTVDPATIQLRTAWLEDLRQRKRAWHQTRVDVPGYDDAVPIKPQAIMKLLGELMPENTIYSVDAGNPGIWSHILHMHPGTRYMKPVGFGNMAFALPGAIAAKLAEPESPVVCLVGDGSLGMSLAEIETAVRCKVPIIIVVMNDVSYGNIKQEQLHYFGPRYIGVDFVDARFDLIAKAFQANGVRVHTIPELKEALSVAMNAKVPYLIDVMIDPAESVWVKPF